MTNRLKDKITIVTGAAHGIGKAIAEGFAAEGAWVLVADIDSQAGEDAAEQIRRNGGRAEFLRVDISSNEQLQAAVDLAAKQNGRIDVLCNNAAYIAPWHDLASAEDDEWRQCLDITLMGTVNLTRLVLPFMIQQRAGSIIHVSSIQGMVGARQSAAYTTVKTALIGLARSAAYDYGPQNVRVNALCPGAIQTRISPKPGEPLYERQVSKTFLNRVGQPHEVAAAAIFLASDESSYITGAVLPVDGGWTAM
jgi:NAD(P)-dependent dehydrogenase (short-subunit alcohol dehydrogenase family)